jgi:chromosome segregation ATPase
MEGTFVQELEHLSAKLGHQAEVAHFWQLKYSSLHAAHGALEARLADCRAEIEERARELDEKEDRERDSTTRISSLLIEREALRDGFSGARREAQSREAEVEGCERRCGG